MGHDRRPASTDETFKKIFFGSAIKRRRTGRTATFLAQGPANLTLFLVLFLFYFPLFPVQFTGRFF